MYKGVEWSGVELQIAKDASRGDCTYIIVLKNRCFEMPHRSHAKSLFIPSATPTKPPLLEQIIVFLHQRHR